MATIIIWRSEPTSPFLDDPTLKSLEDYLPPNRCQSLKFNLFYIVKLNKIKASHQQLKSNSVLNSKLLTGSYPRLIPWVDLDKKLQPSKKRILTNRLPPLSTIKDCLKQTLRCNFRSMKIRACLSFFLPQSLWYFSYNCKDRHVNSSNMPSKYFHK